MLLKFIMRDTSDAIVSGTPTVTADGEALTPTGDANGWEVDAPLGSLVSCTLTGAMALDVMMPTYELVQSGMTAQGYTAALGALLNDWILKGLRITDNGDGTKTIELMDGETVLKTWTETTDGLVVTRSEAT